MATIAFIGLGIMGGPMAGHLVKAGHTVIGVNRSPAPVQKLVEAGGRGAESVAEAVAEAEIIITMVPDSPDVEGLALGDDGIYANARSGAIHLDMSSIRPDVSVRLAEAGRERGVRVLDAPVSGGEAGAKEATLSIMVGGDEADFKEARPIIEAVGSTIVYVGPAKPSRRPTSSSSPEPSSWWLRRSCSSRRTASTPRRQSPCWRAAWPATR